MSQNNHHLAIDLLKREIDNITKAMVVKEQQVADLVYQLEEFKLSQQELIESIQKLGEDNA